MTASHSYSTKRLYVASAIGFSELGMLVYGRLLSIVRRTGYEVIDPWKLTPANLIARVAKLPYGPKKRKAWHKLNKIIGQNNANGIERADGILAILDGPDVDSGTASEIGYAAALGKSILGYRGDFRLSADNEGSTVNLQVEYFIRQKGTIISKLAQLPSVLRTVFGKPNSLTGSVVMSGI